MATIDITNVTAIPNPVSITYTNETNNTYVLLSTVIVYDADLGSYTSYTLGDIADFTLALMSTGGI